MTEFITRNYGQKEFEVIIKTDNKEHYKATQDFARKLIDHAKPQTHADRIRAMSDEELAKWLLEVMKHKVACFGEGAFKYTPCRNVEHDCVKCGVEWLKQPVEE